MKFTNGKAFLFLARLYLKLMIYEKSICGYWIVIDNTKKKKNETNVRSLQRRRVPGLLRKAGRGKGKV